MTTIRLSGGDLGAEVLMVRADLSQASATVEVDYGTGDGWEPTQYQTADARHIVGGLEDIGRRLAATALELTAAGVTCDAEILD